MISSELLVAGAALIIAAIWIIYLQFRLTSMEYTFDEAEDALEAADAAINTYHAMLVGVALNETTLEITHDGRIIATHHPDRAVQRH